MITKDGLLLVVKRDKSGKGWRLFVGEEGWGAGCNFANATFSNSRVLGLCLFSDYWATFVDMGGERRILFHPIENIKYKETILFDNRSRPQKTKSMGWNFDDFFSYLIERKMWLKVDRNSKVLSTGNLSQCFLFEK